MNGMIDLTTQCFIIALCRFMFRIGKYAQIQSDIDVNDTNAINIFLNKDPHFGSLWEAGMNSGFVSNLCTTFKFPTNMI